MNRNAEIRAELAQGLNTNLEMYLASPGYGMVAQRVQYLESQIKVLARALSRTLSNSDPDMTEQRNIEVEEAIAERE